MQTNFGAQISDAAYQLVLLQEKSTVLQNRLLELAHEGRTENGGGQIVPPSPALIAARRRLDEVTRMRNDLRQTAAQEHSLLKRLEEEVNENAAFLISQDDRRDHLRDLVGEMEAEKSRRLAEVVAPFSCELCGGDEHPVDDAFPLQCCGRRVCREMMTGYAVAEIGEARVPVRCPFKNQQCRGEVGEMELVTLLDDGAYGQYRRIQLRQIQEMQGMAFCRAADCNGMIFRDDLGQPGTASTTSDHFVCTVNEEHQWCLQCDVIWHKGSTCAQYQEWKQNNANGDAEVERLVREMGWRRCPGCQNGVERVAGCNAMKCRCGAGFCYLCGFNAPGGDAHGHFNEPGPCHGKVWANP